MGDWFNLNDWLTVPVFASMAAWVGRVHQRVDRNQADIAEFTKGFSQHIKDDAVAHEKIARIEERVTSIHKTLEKMDRTLERLASHQ